MNEIIERIIFMLIVLCILFRMYNDIDSKDSP